MKNYIRFLLFLVLSTIGRTASHCQELFEVNLNDRSGDTFKVSLHPDHLTGADTIFQFASTAPGTYQVMDIGRFVGDFKAFDRSGDEIPTHRGSTNQWSISQPDRVEKITYTMADIWNAKVETHPVFLMAGTSISDDFVMLNGQAVFGYFPAHQAEPMRIKLDYPASWKVGTALAKDADGLYEADDFDNATDSPFFLGKLSVATTTIGGAKISVYTYSLHGLIASDSLLASLKDILKAESDFMHGLPVDRYAFLFYFGDRSAGAWEHSYSSEYVLHEDTLTSAFAHSLASTVAHEFFHINTPLHIHSELIEHFNFAKPVMSQHLWLYEGTTEWAAHILQLRDSLITLQEYLKVIQDKLNANDAFDQSVSLTRLGVDATEMPDQYPNIYQKGAVVSALLDIRLLKLSHGSMGLRDLLLQLSHKYGKKRAFSEENFFDELTAMTYPEIGDFINRYIKGTDELPLKEEFGWLGIDYSEEGDIDSTRSSLRIAVRPSRKGIAVASVFKSSKSGLMPGDVIEKIGGTPLTFSNIQALLGKMTSLPAGSVDTITVKRGEKEVDVASVLLPRLTRHKFIVNPQATPEELALREAWMRNK